MGYELYWSKSAKQDIIKLYTFLDDNNPAAAWRMMETLGRAADRLLLHPFAGKPIPGRDEDRQLVVPFAQTTYLPHYRVRDTTIAILSVHSARENWH